MALHANFDFSGGVVVITGGASGIGAALARRIAQAGGTAVVTDVQDKAGVALAAEEHGLGKIEFEHLDVSRRPDVDDVFQRINDRHGRIDGLVCGAIVQPTVDVLDVTPDEWARVFGVNLYGVIWCTQAAVKTAMIPQRSGSIVMFASGTADTGKAKSGPYTTSKGAVASYTRTFAREMAPHRVRVNLCRPGMVETDQFRNSNPGMDMSHLDRPEDPAGSLLFLLSDAAQMTGSIVSKEMLWRSEA